MNHRWIRFSDATNDKWKIIFIFSLSFKLEFLAAVVVVMNLPVGLDDLGSYSTPALSYFYF